LVVAGLLAERVIEPPLLMVVPQLADAESVRGGLELLAPETRVALAPGEVASVYGAAELPLSVRVDAVATLERIAHGAVDVVVTPARALLASVPRPETVAAHTMVLQSGDECEPVELARRLAKLGYRRVDLVEEAGDVAVRGEVIDVHPGGVHGVRIELDDLWIDRLRPFDPSTQRTSGEPFEVLHLRPLELYPMDADSRELLALEVAGALPAMAAAIRSGVERRLWWGALKMVADTTTWLDLGWPVVACDLDEVAGELARWYQVQRREWATLTERHFELPSPEVLLASPEAVNERLEMATLHLERLEVQDRTTRWWRVAVHPQDEYVRRIPDLAPTVRDRRAIGLAQLLVVGSGGEKRRFEHLLAEADLPTVDRFPGSAEIAVVEAGLDRGFVWDGGLAIYGRRDLTAAPRPRRRAGGLAKFLSDLRDLKPGDLVVHVDHGIGRFDGFRRVPVEGRTLEMMVLAYHGGDTLMVPVERADLIQKFAGGESEAPPRLDRLGGSTWRRRTARVRKAVREMAGELLRLAAVRRTAEGYRYSPDSPWQREFEEAFAFELTSDQAAAVEDIKRDMESARSMDRLLCGDVGYGKTEVAIRVAFKAVLDGKQVAVLAPTTVLADQHLQTFIERFQGFPVEVRVLSRFVAPADAREVLAGLAEGTVDVVVGTHRLLAADVRFRDLGLVIVDEEQRFGVAQKERLKRLRTEVDVLAMSATPIPRSLHMSLTGLRDVSLIETPPRDRQAVETTVLEFSEAAVREAVLYELERGGQVFFVHNRVRSIGALAEWLRTAVPEARVVVAHGQLPERYLERAMRTFLDGEADVLLATAIIENGLDISNANTLLVNRADRFGLAQLYQLRGRVGRSERLAFAYFLVPPGAALSASARARLGAIQEFCDLGAGFRIAARDLEIRGAGNLLGGEQHGFIEAVGFETYCQLLEEAIAELEGQPVVARREVELKLGLDVQLPESYVPEPSLRLSFYKRLAGAVDDDAVADLVAEMRDRYGSPPSQLDNLALGQRIRIAAREAGMLRVARTGGGWKLQLDPGLAAPPTCLPELVGQWPGSKVSPTGEIRLPGGNGGAQPSELLGFLKALAAG
jgi:transcription-repair coupling factor (superfamily II helicase)